MIAPFHPLEDLVMMASPVGRLPTIFLADVVNFRPKLGRLASGQVAKGELA